MNKMLTRESDVVLIGAGIMSATLGAFLKEVEPDLNITMFERLESPAQESTHPWNNAGTGHAAFCELNYTPQRSDGSVDISKVVKINKQFNRSLEFWSHLVKKNKMKAEDFIYKCPHMSFVWGEDNINFLQQRYKAMNKHHFFKEMQYTEDKEQIEKWAPLIMEGREKTQKVAATYMDEGSDINFGALTAGIISDLSKAENFSLNYNTEVRNFKKLEDGRWEVEYKNLKTKEVGTIIASFVFAGAGGEALTLLQKSKIPQAKGYAGFPISGIWLKCTSEELAHRHHVKVYGKAEAGSPPMSVPHLDARTVNEKRSLLFGPYAGFSTKFLKNGSYCDLFKSMRINNLKPMFKAAKDNWDLTTYLIKEVLKSKNKQFLSLKEYFPNAKIEDWLQAIAGQRVQIIKADEKKGGILEFGTRVITCDDNSFVALLGASPGASIAADIAVNIIENSFPEKLKNNNWQEKIKNILPSYKKNTEEDELLYQNIHQELLTSLKLN